MGSDWLLEREARAMEDWGPSVYLSLELYHPPAIFVESPPFSLRETGLTACSGGAGVECQVCGPATLSPSCCKLISRGWLQVKYRDLTRRHRWVWLMVLKCFSTEGSLSHRNALFPATSVLAEALSLSVRPSVCLSHTHRRASPGPAKVALRG